MTKDRAELSAAAMLASLVTGSGQSMHAEATVQRSHRFPLHLFAQMENLAHMGKVPVSLIINQLIESGLQAVKRELPADVIKKMTLITQAQLDRPLVTDKVEVKSDRRVTKLKPTKAR